MERRVSERQHSDLFTLVGHIALSNHIRSLA